MKVATKNEITDLFNNIAPKYDFLNHFLSFGIDKWWRKKAIKTMGNLNHQLVLDVACGTGDFAFEAIKQGAKQVVGIDISQEMLHIAIQKAKKKNLSEKMQFQLGSSHEIPFDNQSFDVATVAFGVRNFAYLEQGLSEIFRVLRENGTAVILEFSMPTNSLFAWIYKIYFFRFLPFIGGLISNNKKAYQYLPQSVASFPKGNDFLNILSNCGFKNREKIKLSFGIAHIYIGKK